MFVVGIDFDFVVVIGIVFVVVGYTLIDFADVDDENLAIVVDERVNLVIDLIAYVSVHCHDENFVVNVVVVAFVEQFAIDLDYAHDDCVDFVGFGDHADHFGDHVGHADYDDYVDCVDFVPFVDSFDLHDFDVVVTFVDFVDFAVHAVVHVLESKKKNYIRKKAE